MNRRELVMAALLCCVIMCGLAFFAVRSGGSITGGHAPQSLKISAQFVKQFEGVRAAEKITDKMQRCMAFPNPAEFHWDQKLVEAKCKLTLREMISAKEISHALDEHRPDILDKAFASYLERNYLAGEHGFLIWTYWWMFQGTSPAIADTTRRWVRMDANSPFALAARGTYFVAAAWNVRGDKNINETSKIEFSKMRDYAARAKKDFEATIRYSPRMIEAYYGLIMVAQLAGDHPLLEQSLQNALRLDPADPWVYDRWFEAIKPQWGGTKQQFQAAMQELRRHTADNPILALVPAKLACRAAVEWENCAQCGSAHVRQSAVFGWYEKAFASGPANCALKDAGDAVERMGGNDEMVVEYDTQAYRFLGDSEKQLRSALALQRLGETAWALESVDVLLAKWPKYREAWLYRGWVLEAAHRPAEAEKAFLTVLQANPQNREANTELVTLYLGALHQRAKAVDLVGRLMKVDSQNPRAWLLEAALDHGGNEKQCQFDLTKYLALVDQTTADSYEQRDINRAKARLVELQHKSAN